MYHLYLTKAASGWRIEHPSGHSFARGYAQRGPAARRLRELGYAPAGMVGGAEHWQKESAEVAAFEAKLRLAHAFGRDLSLHL